VQGNGLTENVVAYLDTIGFRQATRRATHASGLFAKIRAALEEEQTDLQFLIGQRSGNSPWSWTTEPDNLRVHRTAFSDSIALSAYGEGAIVRVITKAATTATRLIEAKLPVRGSIARGPLYHRGGVILGEALVNAYAWSRAHASRESFFTTTWSQRCSSSARTPLRARSESEVMFHCFG
jgi:hypothetical protein